jgi:glycogen operon protein
MIEADEPLRRPYGESLIYEMHVRGFTRHPGSGFWLKRARMPA